MDFVPPGQAALRLATSVERLATGAFPRDRDRFIVYPFSPATTRAGILDNGSGR
jgi:hypothetical protein